MRKIIFSLLLFISICSTASAFTDDIERYSTDYTEKYTTLTYTRVGEYGASEPNWNAPVISAIPDTRTEASKNTVLSLGIGQSASINWDTLWHFLYIIPIESTSSPYFSYTITGQVTQSSYYRTIQKVRIYTEDQSAVLAEFDGIYMDTFSVPVDLKIEIIKSGTGYDRYINGVLRDSKISSNQSYTGNVKYCPGVAQDCNAKGGTVKSYLYIDDLTTSSIIGSRKLYTETDTQLTVTWASQLMRSYTDPQKITLYSLTNTENAGKIQSWNIPQEDNSSTTEHGYLNLSRNGVIGLNYGLYLLEMTRGDTVLYDTYFYYDQLSNPQGYPEILFLGESDVSTDIRDEDNHGGTVTGGGSVYLYPSINVDGAYTFTYNILSTPYAIKTELTSVYNTSTITNATINFSGLSTQNYNISADGATVGHTNGADTYSYTFSDWSSETNHIVSFAPDYSLAGVWGEVKNPESQEGIKSATVSVSGDNFSKTLYTDDNGLFYLTKGLEAGKTYTISVSKTGYSTPPSQTAITVEGSTTRQDFYLDKTSTDGSGLYYAPHDVGFTVLEYWYSGAGLTGVNYAIYNGTESLKTGTTDSKGMFTGSDMSGGTNYTITLTYNGTTYTEYVEPSLTAYTFVLNKEGILHQYANSWLTLSYTENTNNVTIAYESNKTLTGASLTAIAGNGTTVYTQMLSSTTGSFTFETGGEGDYTLNFHIEATDGSTASQSWGLSYPDKIPLFPDSYPAWLKNILFSGIVMVFLLAFGKSKNDIACGAVAILTSMGYIFEWFTGSFYFVVLVWIIALGAVFLHYKRTGGIG